MSVDNWAVCPKCLAKHESDMLSKKTEVAEAYGKVPRAEYERLSQELKEDQERDPDNTLRENFEFVNDNEGTLGIIYGAQCTMCSFSCKFEKILNLMDLKE
jgi:hypothetical protein